MSLFQAAEARMRGRPRKIPQPRTEIYPRATGFGFTTKSRKAYPLPRMTPSNIRYFSHTPFCRHAINVIKRQIVQLAWEIRPIEGVALTPELQQQIDAATTVFQRPNMDDDFNSFIGQVVEDILVVSGGAYEQQLSPEPLRPLFMWPVDASSIQIYAAWMGNTNEARYMQTIGYNNVGSTLSGIKLRDEELVYLKPSPTTQNPYSIGPTETAYRAIARLLGAQEYAGNAASNAQPENLLSFPGAGPDWIEVFREYWRNEIEAQATTPIVGGTQDAKLLKLRTANDEGLYLKWQELCVREIAVAFDLSPLSLGLERDVNRNTADSLDSRDWYQAVLPYVSIVASHFTRHTLQNRLGYRLLEFHFTNTERKDETAEALRYEKYYKGNAVIPDEWRIRNGLKPLGSRWGTMTFADTQIALAAAKGSAIVEDPDLTPQSNQPANKSQEK